MFSHTHIVNGTSIVHSHFGGDDGHEHSESQYAVIDMLSQFQSETAADFYLQDILPCTPSEIHIGYSAPAYLSDASDALKLRGPRFRLHVWSDASTMLLFRDKA